MDDTIKGFEMAGAIAGFEMAGAVVRKPYSTAGATVRAGTVLSKAAFLQIGYAVRRLWVRDGNVVPFYVQTVEPSAPAGPRHVIHRGGGRYDVVAGVVLNADPLSRDEAEALAAAAR